MKILKILGLIVLFVIVIATAAGFYVNVALPDTGKAPAVKIEVTPERLERGRYLANHVTACMDCHSSRNWSLFSGPPVAGTIGQGGEVFDENMGFPGKIYAANITPHALGSWTDGEILKAVTTGVNKDGKALFPLMGYSRFGKMDREDIYSIIAYIRSLQPIKSQVPNTELNFPVSLINKTLPKAADFQKKPDASDSLKYGAYLVNAAGCVDCHSKMDKGNIVPGSEFGGGMEFIQPAGIMRSPNITMHKVNGLGNWSKTMFVQRFKMYADSTVKLPGMGRNELNTPMPWTMYAGMTQQDLAAIYTYLNSLKPLDNKVEVREIKGQPL
ncbi:c-type cytochrome [Pedobacter heparinus]|uniref:Cytochrome c family protein n=1 Tax=Pedobacter heparinus (strain ATCC 13125 / DSM 2366 / CIP 104194 / JCM 7457 / NBRC 12017 / NCIMB 9290 / NRRL B-14731 / HIM 762-3) TaxID=485917 RepID=C6Y2E6_PEDHD|nr:cytochrome c [Pedobacter heparinus]ACU05156.1 cytochrome c family protein [Pedobacter heparinus DSM 2366]